MGSTILGDCVRDSITGFEGTVISICQNLHNVDRICVVLHNLDQGKIVQEWFDADRLSVVDKSTMKCVN
ncbi:hypothetical protein LCGC14_0249040 [marine sediment metagenome]|uniref:PRC-barrel domain-containing protein n=1 Tax=marine sediment metagenome TaxID=412755 RepID=A0A0F9ULL9_9ZZZZ